MLSPEPMQTKQKLRWKGLNVAKEWHSYASYVALCVESSISGLLWPVYLAAVVFATGAYIKIGGIGSLSVLVAVLVAVPLGKLLDKQHGRLMIRYATVANVVVHASRMLVAGLTGSFAVAAVNEPVTLVYRMAYYKGFYDEADDHPGYRITYITSHEAIGDIFRTITWLALFVLSLHFSPYVTCAVGFVVAGCASLGIRLERYRALR